MNTHRIYALLRKPALLAVLVTCSLPSFAQIPFGGLITDKMKNKVKEKLVDKLSDARKNYDETNFNYAISLSDNAGLYETNELGKRTQTIAIAYLQSEDKREETPRDKAANMNGAGELFYASNKYKLAEFEFLATILALETENLTDDMLYPLALSNLGLLYHTTGRYSLSEEYTTRALEIRKAKAADNAAGYGASLNNLAVLYKDMGRYDEAEKLFEESLTITGQAKGKNSMPYGISLNNQAVLFQTIGRYQDAEPLMKNAIAIAAQNLGDKSPNYIRLITNLALLYKDMGRNEEAEKEYIKAIDIKKKRLGTAHPDYAALLNQQAALYVQMGKYDKVEELLKKSSDIYLKKFGENHPSYAGAISNLGNFYRISGKLSEATPLLAKVITIRKNTLGENHAEYIAALENQALLQWQKKEIDGAYELFKQVLDKDLELVRTFFPSMSEKEKAKFWNKLRPKFQRFNSFALTARETHPQVVGDMYNYQLATKAMLLSSASKIKRQILGSKDEELKKQYLNWLDQKETLAKWYTYSKEELAEQRINLDSLERVANATEKELSQKSTLFSEGYEQKAVSFIDIAGKLKPEEAAVEILHFKRFDVVFRDTTFYAALILTKEKNLPQLVLLENGRELDTKFFNYYKNCIKQKVEDKHSYNQYWRKIEDALAGKKTVYVSLDGVYNQINLNTLQAASGVYLIDSKNLVLLTNTKDLLTMKPATPVAAARSQAMLVGFPAYGAKGKIAPLPGTKVEVDNIKKVLAAKGYPTRTLLQHEATEDRVKAVNNPRILHIATHGFFMQDVGEDDEKVFGVEPDKARENPLLRSGLMLAGAEQTTGNLDTRQVKSSDNGILTAYEAMNLPLDKTDVVVLSACETGLGEVQSGEGVYGLQRAFQVAGASSIIMSLWKVDDTATQQLMSSFYRNWLQTSNKAQAFKTAQQELKAKYKNPYYWGAFVLVGS
jgi:CHAT domain-containing protein/Flp pilus assembly protein TadD